MTIGDTDAPTVFIRASTDSDQKTPLDVSDRMISFEYIDREIGADLCRIELDNHDLSLYEIEALRAGSKLFVSWGYGQALCPTRTVVIKRSNASNTRPPKGKKKADKIQTRGAEKGVSSVSGGGDTEKGVDVFRIEAYDVSILMHQDHRSRVFENMTRSEVARKIAEEQGFTAKFQFIDDTDESYPVITQSRLTDAQFMKRLAIKEGFEWFVDWDGFHFHKRKLDQPPARTYRYYTDPAVVGPVAAGSSEILKLDEIDANLTARAGGVTVAGYDPLKKREIRERATNADVNRPVLAPAIELIDAESSTTRLERRNVAEHVVPSPQASKDSARREANGLYRKAQQNSVKLKFSVVGDASVLAKTVIDVQGIGVLFSGRYYISEAHHRIHDSGYILSIASRRDGLNKGPQTKGALNRQQPSKDGVTPFEAIDPETSKTQTQWRDSKGRVISVEDPAAGQTILVSK